MTDVTATATALSFPDLLNGGWRDLPFEPFREGIEISKLFDAGDQGPSAAILRYQPGAGAPLHQHTGYETIMVLEGSQSDDRGHYGAGAVVVNPPGTSHSITSEEGCVVLIVWQAPVRFDATS
jgi:anti-sigma factor ChrR (cupin superfamily)